MSVPDLDEVRRGLLARREAARAHLAEFAKAPVRGTNLNFGKRIGDGTTEAIGRLTDFGVGTSLEVSEQRIARALAKLDEGSYGVCDGCGSPIAAARLHAAPDSVLCIECARRRR